MWSIALRTLGDREDAADAVQEAALSAYRRAASFRGEAAVGTWLHRITVNACLDLARRRAVRPSFGLGERDIPAGGHAVDARITSLSVLAALRELPIEQAAAVVLVDLEAYSVAEAAAVLEIPEGTVKSRCSRARARLVDLLGDAGNRPAGQAVEQTETGGDR
jgi:RNA polymerase sigma-70 factor (ECF subfamily)